MKEKQDEIKVRDCHLEAVIMVVLFGMIMAVMSLKENDIHMAYLFFGDSLMVLVACAGHIFRVVVLNKEGCRVSWLFWEKIYKWEELEIIREDYWSGGRYLTLHGIAFSEKKKDKKGRIYTTEKIVGSYMIFKQFYIVFDEDYSFISSYLRKKTGKKLQKKLTLKEVLKKFDEWGVKVEKSEYRERKERQKIKQKAYDEMVSVRKKRREEQKKIVKK